MRTQLYALIVYVEDWMKACLYWLKEYSEPCKGFRVIKDGKFFQYQSVRNSYEYAESIKRSIGDAMKALDSNPMSMHRMGYDD